MQWVIQHGDAIATIVVLCGFMGWIKKQVSKESEEKFKAMDEKFKKIDESFVVIREDLSEIKKHISSIDQRLSKLEGRFEERGYWESRLESRRAERQAETISTIPLLESKRRRGKRKITSPEN